MKSIGKFPFGEPVREVVQTDRSPKDIFVLGVYASAVHARWINTSGKTVVNALAVASEPYIFWRGESSETIIQDIPIPKQLGKLVPAAPKFNGPSGMSLDNQILKPLGLERQSAWLCDLVPHSCMNPSQAKAIERAYLPMAQEFGLVTPSVPPVPRTLADDNRREAIVEEIFQSKAKILVMLGDQPVRWFLSKFDGRWRKLSDFGQDMNEYGQLHNVQVSGTEIFVLPLAHPRQISRLGLSSENWYRVHENWVKHLAGDIANYIEG